MKLSKKENQWLYDELSNKIVETRELLEDARRNKTISLSSYYGETIFMCESIRNKIETEDIGEGVLETKWKIVRITIKNPQSLKDRVNLVQLR